MAPLGIDWGAVRPEAIPLLLFSLRAGDLTLSTLRMLTVMRGRRLSAWILALLQASFFLLGAAGLLGNLRDPVNVLAYAAGYATGNVIGMGIENLAAPGHSLLRVISRDRAEAVLDSLWRQGWGATQVPGRGQDGTVGFILCYIPRRALRAVQHTVQQSDPEAFVTVQQVRALRGGWQA